MSKWRRSLAFLLSAVIMISLLPAAALADWRTESHVWKNALSTVPEAVPLEMLPVQSQEINSAKNGSYGDVDLYSMMPLKEEELEVDLRGYFPSELTGVRLETLLPKVSIPNDSALIWSRLGNGNYTISNRNGTIDLSKEQRDARFEIIVGKPDQLDLTNTRYLVTVRIAAPAFDGILDMDATYASGERGSIRVLDSQYHHSDSEYRSDYNYRNDETEEEGVIGEYRFTVDETWRDGPVYLSMSKQKTEEEADAESSNESADNVEESSEKNGFEKLEARIYEGIFLTLEDFHRVRYSLPAKPEAITMYFLPTLETRQ